MPLAREPSLQSCHLEKKLLLRLNRACDIGRAICRSQKELHMNLNWVRRVFSTAFFGGVAALYVGCSTHHHHASGTPPIEVVPLDEYLTNVLREDGGELLPMTAPVGRVVGVEFKSLGFKSKGGAGSATGPLNPPPGATGAVAAMSRSSLAYAGDDHHVKQVASGAYVYKKSGAFRLAVYGYLRDINGDDDFNATIQALIIWYAT
jgi:hypothetical protein